MRVPLLAMPKIQVPKRVVEKERVLILLRAQDDCMQSRTITLKVSVTKLSTT